MRVSTLSSKLVSRMLARSSMSHWSEKKPHLSKHSKWKRSLMSNLKNLSSCQLSLNNTWLNYKRFKRIHSNNSGAVALGTWTRTLNIWEWSPANMMLEWNALFVVREKKMSYFLALICSVRSVFRKIWLQDQEYVLSIEWSFNKVMSRRSCGVKETCDNCYYSQENQKYIKIKN